MKYNGPKAKLCRKIGSNIYGPDKYDRILQRKPYGPGKGPRSRRGKRSEYAEQLMEKQKVRSVYGVAEKQFKKYYHQAQRLQGVTGPLMLQLLERRLDNAIYRAGFAMTRLQARQIAGHGMFLVNGRRCDTPSRQLKVGDVLEVRPRSASSPLFVSVLQATEKYMPPSWLKVDPSKLRIEVLSIPTDDHYEQGLDIQKVIELYSR